MSQTITELRESKSFMTECLKQKTTELSNVSQRCSELSLRIHNHHETVRGLNEQVVDLRSRPQPDTELPQRLRESERAQDELRVRAKELEKLLEQQQFQSRGIEQETFKLQQQLEKLKKHIESAENANASLKEDVQAAEVEKSMRLEELRAQLLRAADIEKTDLKRRYEENVCALTSSRDVAERHINTLQEENKALKTGSTFATERVNSLERRIEEARDREKQLNETNASQEQRLQRAESEVQVWKETCEANAARFTNLASRLQISEAQNTDMDGRIRSLTQSLSESQALAATVPDLEGRLKDAQNEKVSAEKTAMYLQKAVLGAQSRRKSFHSSDGSGFQATADVSSPCARYQRDGARKPLPSEIEESQQSPIVRFCSSIWDMTIGGAPDTQTSDGIGPQNLPLMGQGQSSKDKEVSGDESQHLLSDQSPDGLYEDIDLIAAPEAQNSAQEFHACPTQRTDCNDGGHRNDIETQKSTIQETPQNSARESQPFSQYESQQSSPKQPQRIAGHNSVFQIPRSGEQGQQNFEGEKSHHFDVNSAETTLSLTTPAVPTAIPSELSKADNKAETETRSNSSRRRTPSRTLQPLRLSPNARPLQEIQANTARDITGSASSLRQGAVGKKRPFPNDTSGRSAGLLSRPNKFHRARQENSQVSVPSGDKHTKISPDHRGRGSRGRVSKGEVRGLGPIVGSVQSPSVESSHNARRRKSRRKVSGISGS